MIMRLEVLAGSGNHVRLPGKLARKVGIKQSRGTIDVRVGQRVVSAHYSLSSMVATVALSEALLGKLSLRRGMRLQVQLDQKQLHIGPLVGVLVPGTRGGFNPVGNMTLGVGYFIEQGRYAGSYPFAFAASAMDFKKSIVRGYTLSSLGGEGFRWIRRTFPLPDVVYNHITYRRRERAADIQKLLRQLGELNIPVFNSGYFGKWEVHNWLSCNEALQPHLPETHQLSLETLQEMLTRYPRVFIKPDHGSLGRKIAVVTRSGNHYLFRRGRRASSQVVVQDLNSMMSRLPKLTRDVYLVQQGLNLCRYHGRRRDFRLIMQRNSSGRWLITKFFARVAPGGQLVANISAGATGLPAGRSLRRCFSAARTKSIIKEMKRVARLVCHTLTAVMDDHLGELGIDLGIDTSGHVWIIEVNSKPHRKVYDTMDSLPSAKLSFRRPMQFAQYVAGFK
jgi:glutathione synthase/RimK-type ligase-like ATP-grasp enzyme